LLFFSRSNVRALKRRSLVAQIAVTILGAELLFLSGFTAFSLPTATGRNLQAWGHNLTINAANCLPSKYQQIMLSRFPQLSAPPHPVRYSLYTPIVPAAIFAGYILGPLLGAAAAILYLLAGLVGPYLGTYLFAAGGGFSYYTEPGMGYLLGLIPGCWCVGRLAMDQRKSIKQLAAAVCGVCAIHITGMGYVLGLCIAGHFTGNESALFWRPWTFEELRNMTWYQLPYDLSLSLLVIGVGFPFRWLVNVLTAPDASTKTAAPSQLEELIH
jgi:biotin transporter BioY